MLIGLIVALVPCVVVFAALTVNIVKSVKKTHKMLAQFNALK